MSTDEPPFVSNDDWAPDHPHQPECRCAKCECDRHPPFGIGPPFISDGRTLDDEGTCTRCGVPDVHCQCLPLNLVERRMKKAISMMRLPEAEDG